MNSTSAFYQTQLLEQQYGIRETAMLKEALVGGGGDETEFEKAFAGIAYATIRNKAPRLLDYMVGFQLVDRNEDRSKAMGAFGFRVGKRWLLAPVFFLNGEIKGHEVLYAKDNDSCVPLKENWVNYLISHEPHEIGEPSGATNIGDLGASRPNLRTLSIVPSAAFGKWGSDNAWFEQFKPWFASIAVKSASTLYPEIKNQKLAYDAVVDDPLSAALAPSYVREAFDLNQYMSQDFAAFRGAYDTAQRVPIIKAAFAHFYGPDCFSRWAGELLTHEREKCANVLDAPPTAARAVTGSLIADASPAPVDDPVKSGALRIYFSHSVIGNAPADLSTDEKESLLRDGSVVKDKRASGQTSRLLRERSQARLLTPRQTGLYDVLESDGTCDRMLAITHGITPSSAEFGQLTLVRLAGDSKAWCHATPSTVFAEHEYETDEWNEWYDSLPDVKSLSEGAQYVVLGKNRAATVPFVVQSSVSDDEYRVTQLDSYPHDQAKGLSFERMHANQSDDPHSFRVLLLPSSYASDRIRRVAGTLQIPRGCKLLKLSDSSRDRVVCDWSLLPGETPPERKGRPISLGSIHDVHRLIHAKTASLRVRRSSSELLLKSAAFGDEICSESEALESLLYDHGLSAEDARTVVKTATAAPTDYRIVYAPTFGQEKKSLQLRQDMHYTSFGNEDEDVKSTMNLSPRTSVNMRHPYHMDRPIPELSASQTDPSQFDMWQNYMAQDFNKVMQVAQIAASRNQKEVFDVSMFTGLIKTVSQNSLVERHLPALVRALDSFGQLLLSFYWHSSEFAERYGKNDLPELEDSLRNAFDAVGEVTLFLKEKTIESPFGKGEVDLDDSSRS